MSEAGRLSRGEANYTANKFLDNSETLEYMATLKKEVPKDKPKEAKYGKSKSR